MPKTDPETLGQDFAAQLRQALDRIQPPGGPPRYLSMAEAGRLSSLRLAPFALAIALTGILGLTAWAATGSTNPSVWTNRVETVIAPTSPAAAPSPTGAPPEKQRSAPAAPARQPSPAPSQRPEPTNSPEPSESPEDGGHSGAASGSRTWSDR